MGVVWCVVAESMGIVVCEPTKCEDADESFRSQRGDVPILDPSFSLDETDEDTLTVGFRVVSILVPVMERW